VRGLEGQCADTAARLAQAHRQIEERDLTTERVLAERDARERDLRRETEALLRSRVRYQGTDGVRGTVAGDREGVSPREALVERGEFTPGLVDLLCAAAEAEGIPHQLCAWPGQTPTDAAAIFRASLRAARCCASPTAKGAMASGWHARVLS
jgi:hypothetical protein